MFYKKQAAEEDTRLKCLDQGKNSFQTSEKWVGVYENFPKTVFKRQKSDQKWVGVYENFRKQISNVRKVGG